MELGPHLALLGIETPRYIFAVAAEELRVPVDFAAILVTTGMEKLVRKVLCFARWVTAQGIIGCPRLPRVFPGKCWSAGSHWNLLLFTDAQGGQQLAFCFHSLLVPCVGNYIPGCVFRRIFPSGLYFSLSRWNYSFLLSDNWVSHTITGCLVKSWKRWNTLGCLGRTYRDWMSLMG